MSEPWSSKQRSKKGRGRPLFGVNAVVCPKKKKVTKNARKKTKKDLTGPTLLEMPIIRPGDENAFSGYFVCPAFPYCCLHQERIVRPAIAQC